MYFNLVPISSHFVLQNTYLDNLRVHLNLPWNCKQHFNLLKGFALMSSKTPFHSIKLLNKTKLVLGLSRKIVHTTITCHAI